MSKRARVTKGSRVGTTAQQLDYGRGRAIFSVSRVGPRPSASVQGAARALAPPFELAIHPGARCRAILQR
eukprot:5474595-Pyramimonas_sp.AAC.1